MATVPTMDTFVSGEKVTAAKLNKNIRDASAFLLNPPSVSLKAAVTQSVAHNTPTDIVFDTELWDTDSMWITGATVTVNTPGLYEVNVRLSFAANATGHRYVTVLQNGNPLGRVLSPAFATYAWSNNFTRIVRAAQGDVFKVNAWQTSTVALGTGTGTTDETTFQARWVGV